MLDNISELSWLGPIVLNVKQALNQHIYAIHNISHPLTDFPFRNFIKQL